MNTNRALGVDFTMPVDLNEWSLVVPIRRKPNLKMMLNIFGYEIWMALLAMIPCYILVLGLTDYIYYGKVNWDYLAGFVMRTAMVEGAIKPLPDVAKSYQKLLIIFWTLPMFLLAASYAGNMTSFMAKPFVEKPIRDAEHLVNQNEMSWIMTLGTPLPAYFKGSEPGTWKRRLYDNAGKFTIHDCYTIRNEPEWKRGEFAAPCSGISYRALISYDYSKTGMCNYYTTPDTLWNVNFAMVTQVC